MSSNRLSGRRANRGCRDYAQRELKKAEELAKAKKPGPLTRALLRLVVDADEAGIPESQSPIAEHYISDPEARDAAQSVLRILATGLNGGEKISVPSSCLPLLP